jgi:hypothetical protein
LYRGDVCFLLGRREARFLSLSVRTKEHSKQIRSEGKTFNTDQIRRNTQHRSEGRTLNKHRSDQKEGYSTLIRSEGTPNTDHIRRKDIQHKSDQKEEHSTQIRSDQKTHTDQQIRLSSKDVRHRRHLNECTTCS